MAGFRLWHSLSRNEARAHSDASRRVIARGSLWCSEPKRLKKKRRAVPVLGIASTLVMQHRPRVSFRGLPLYPRRKRGREENIRPKRARGNHHHLMPWTHDPLLYRRAPRPHLRAAKWRHGSFFRTACDNHRAPPLAPILTESRRPARRFLARCARWSAVTPRDASLRGPRPAPSQREA